MFAEHFPEILRVCVGGEVLHEEDRLTPRSGSLSEGGQNVAIIVKMIYCNFLIKREEFIPA